MKNKGYWLLAVAVIIACLIGVVLASQVNKADETTKTDTNTTHSDTSSHSTSTESTDSGDTAETNQVNIADFAFTPATIKVKLGTTVTWTNKDSVRHDVSPDTESEDFKGSELLAKGESYKFTFAKAGTYTYHCTPHPQMTATVVVTE
jgi:amicyanin